MLSESNQRLVNEIKLLQRCEKSSGLRAKGIIDQLIVDTDRPLPDVIPPVPRWVRFEWPASQSVNLADYWREVDRRGGMKWTGEYL